MRQKGWLAGRDTAFQEALLSKAVVRLYREGEFLYHIGDAGDGLYCLLSGAVMLSLPSDDGQEFASYRHGAGFWVGDLAMLSNETRLVSVMAKADCRVVVVSASHIQSLLRDTPEYYREFYALSHENMRIVLRTQANLAVLGAERRLVLRLIQLESDLANEQGWIPMSQEELAAMVAVSLPTMQRLLRKLSSSGGVELGYGRLRIVDRDVLGAPSEN